MIEEVKEKLDSLNIYFNIESEDGYKKLTVSEYIAEITSINKGLLKQIEELKSIDIQHRILNGELRKEIKRLKGEDNER